jgi:hypothetical protein
LIEFNECTNNEIEELKKEINYLGQIMSKQIAESRETAKDMDIGFELTNKFMARLERGLDKANKNNAELNLKLNQTLNELDSNTKNNELFKKQAGR